MQTRCIREGQVEIGIIEHEGHKFSALGATVVGREITAYTKLVDDDIHLMTWCGKTMLVCRSEVVERFWSGAIALMFRLPRGRYIVGYALGENGMLFRGEMISAGDEGEARHHAMMIADCFAQLDADDEAFHAESEDRLLNIDYRCPQCGHEWQEQWSCACDSECPNCGTTDITALSWDEAE